MLNTLLTKCHENLVVLILLLFCSCFSPSRLTNQNLSYLYSRDNIFLHPEYLIHHDSDTTSRLFVSIDNEQLLFSKADSENSFTASVSLHFLLKPSYESDEVTDSGMVNMTISADEYPQASPQSGKINSKVFSVPFKATLSRNYILDVTIRDNRRNQSDRRFIQVEKRTFFNDQYFYVKDIRRETPLFKQFLGKDEQVSIHFPQKKEQELIVHYYNMVTPPSLPPFAIRTVKDFSGVPDSVYTIMEGEPVSFIHPGLYHIISDTLTQHGLTLLRFQDDFPKVTGPKELYEPLRYISTQEEFEDMHFPVNKKTAIDNFWLKIGGNYERARKIIANFYNRVQDANRFFTSYKEGWKTDRGMIFVIYGPPDVMYKSTYNETWIYGEEGNIMSLNFNFDRVQNIFSGNDYLLNRSTIYKNSWYLAVDAWRQGVIY